MSMFRKRDWRSGARRVFRDFSDSITDRIMDHELRKALQRFRKSIAYQAVPSANILIVGVQSPKRGNSLSAIFNAMKSSKHNLVTASREVGSLSKPENTNVLIDQFDLKEFDYIITTDDDIELPKGFIDDIIAVMSLSNLDIAGPAQRLRSYHNLDITRRNRNALVRITNYVEVGPTVVFRKNTFSSVMPFPVNRFGWGIDLLWSKIADEKGWKLGIVDGTPIRHLSPAGSTYNWAAAHAEMEQFRTSHSIPLNVDNLTVRDHELTLAEINGFTSY